MSLPRTRIYLGPTLTHEEAREILDVEYYPPITYECLARAKADGVDVIGIIDAVFFMKFTATPTQILDCLREGIVMYGAASAGALRAVETDRFGMRGVGDIYHLYKSGFDAEDKVAVTFDPETLKATSEAMVNVRYAMEKAHNLNVLSQDSHDALIVIAKSIYFSQRTYEDIFKKAQGQIPDTELEVVKQFINDYRNDLDRKRLDAIECLQNIKTYLIACAERSRHGF